jgi:hypothetical protein
MKMILIVGRMVMVEPSGRHISSVRYESTRHKSCRKPSAMVRVPARDPGFTRTTRHLHLQSSYCCKKKVKFAQDQTMKAQRGVDV